MGHLSITLVGESATYFETRILTRLSRFKEWVNSCEEPVDNPAHIRACLVADHDCIVQMAGMMGYLE